jgi:predicted GIY-YIG superfamily endonuclease
MITRAKFGRSSNFAVRRCNKPRCQLCSIIIEGNSFYFKNSNFNFKVNEDMSCETLNCIYVLKCHGCEDIYIGETNNFRLRTNLHRDQILKRKGLGVCMHVNECTQGFEKKFSIMPFFKIKKDDEKLRKQKEAHFISKFVPELNKEM